VTAYRTLHPWLQTYGADAKPDAVKDRVRRARAWLERTQPADTEDRAFRLWGLTYANAKPGEAAAVAKDLLATQRGDGGWSQVDTQESDAYATGSALVALHEAGGLATNDPAYRRGGAFLVNTQKDDGTWFVVSVCLHAPFPTALFVPEVTRVYHLGYRPYCCRCRHRSLRPSRVLPQARSPHRGSAADRPWKTAKATRLWKVASASCTCNIPRLARLDPGHPGLFPHYDDSAPL
jgi:hypothetical protein